MFVGGQAPEDKKTGPSAEMMERLRSDPERPATRNHTVVPKLTDAKVNKSLTAVLVNN